MKIAFGNDHAAREVRAELIEYAKSLGHEVVDYGYAGDGSADTRSTRAKWPTPWSMARRIAVFWCAARASAWPLRQ